MLRLETRVGRLIEVHLQVIREANNPNRRYFEDPERLCAWLGEVLDEAEQGRLREFCAEASSPAAER